jgi:hypothetical protein
LNPRTRVPEASMLTTRPPKPLVAKVNDTYFDNLCILYKQVLANFMLLLR